MIAARFPARREENPLTAETRIALPRAAPWHDVLRDQKPIENLELSGLLSGFPVAVLVGREGAHSS